MRASRPRSCAPRAQARELHRRSGAPVHPMTPLTKLMWFARHEPETCAAARWWVGPEGLPAAAAHRRARHRAVVGVGHRPARHGDAHVERRRRSRWPASRWTSSRRSCPRPPRSRWRRGPRRDRAAGRARRWSPAPPTGRSATSAPARSTPGRRRAVARHQRRDPDGRPGAARSTTQGTLFCYALTDSAWVVGGAISNGGVVVRWAGELARPGRSTAGGRGACSTSRRRPPPAATGS